MTTMSPVNDRYDLDESRIAAKESRTMLSIFRTSDGSYSLVSFSKGWITLMAPLALVAWTITQSIPVSILSFLSLPLYGACQGMMLIFSYRSSFGDSPLPKTPAHGVVFVDQHDAIKTQHEQPLGTQCSCCCTGGQRWRRGALSENEKHRLDQALHQEPLRMLVIGDSLALGVGTTSSCTSIMPEIIAKTLSKSFQRPILWTSHGSPGASTGWIVRELQQGVKNGYQAPKVELIASQTAEIPYSSFWADNNSTGGRNVEDPDDFCQWRNRLNEFRTADLDNSYDIVIIITGANDVKGALFPILVKGEESMFLKDAQKRGFSLMIELERVLKYIRPRMSKSSGPLVVFPAMPSELLPVFRKPPIQWLAVPVMGIMENQKKQLALKHEDCLFLEAPTLDLSIDFEAQKGLYWEQRVREDTLLALRDVSGRECESICRAMNNYCEKKGDMPLYPKGSTSSSQANIPEPPLCDRKCHETGSKIVFIDKIHPSDEGYDFWGRHIARGIIQHLALKKRLNRQNVS